MSAGFIVREARAEDLDAILTIERTAPTAPHWAEAVYAAMLTGDPARLVLAAVSGGTVLGFAVAGTPADTAELESVAVAEASRGCGVGEALCRAAIAWSWSRGAEAIELEVRAASEAVRRLYRRLGFVEVGVRPRYYADPPDGAVRMRLTRDA